MKDYVEASRGALAYLNAASRGVYLEVSSNQPIVQALALLHQARNGLVATRSDDVSVVNPDAVQYAQRFYGAAARAGIKIDAKNDVEVIDKYRNCIEDVIFEKTVHDRAVLDELLLVLQHIR